LWIFGKKSIFSVEKIKKSGKISSMTNEKTVAEVWAEAVGIWQQHAAGDARIEFLSTDDDDASAPWIEVEFLDRGTPTFTIVRRLADGGAAVSSLKIWFEKNTIFVRPENTSEAVQLWDAEVANFIEDSVVHRIEQSRDELLETLIAHG